MEVVTKTSPLRKWISWDMTNNDIWILWAVFYACLYLSIIWRKKKRKKYTNWDNLWEERKERWRNIALHQIDQQYSARFFFNQTSSFNRAKEIMLLGQTSDPSSLVFFFSNRGQYHWLNKQRQKRRKGWIYFLKRSFLPTIHWLDACFSQTGRLNS